VRFYITIYIIKIIIVRHYPRRRFFVILTITAKAEMRRVLSIYPGKVAYPLPKKIPDNIQLLFLLHSNEKYFLPEF